MAEKLLTAETKWSFSKLSAYAECPFGFWLRYCQDPPLQDEGNAWSDFGNLCHKLLEQYALGELSLFQLPEEYEDRYNEVVVHRFPPIGKDYAEKTYQQGLEYFENFEGFDDAYDIVSAEERFEISVSGYQIVGISDLVLREKERGALLVVDHKTKSLKSMKHDYPLYRNQLYLYAEHVHQKYGCYPETLMFNLIKDPAAPFIETFDPEQMEATKKWMVEQIDKVYLDDTWDATQAQKIREGKGDFYCRWICPMLGYCTEAQEAIKNRGRH